MKIIFLQEALRNLLHPHPNEVLADTTNNNNTKMMKISRSLNADMLYNRALFLPKLQLLHIPMEEN
jgi:hypothetical protein